MNWSMLQVHSSFILVLFIIHSLFINEADVWTLLHFNRCGMGPLLVLVSPCFRGNVVVTCKIGSFLCSLDNLLQKNVIVFFFENQISKWRSLEKGAIFDLLFTFFVTRESYKNSFRTYLTHIHACILLTLLTFLPYQFWKKYEFIRYDFSQ